MRIPKDVVESLAKLLKKVLVLHCIASLPLWSEQPSLDNGYVSCTVGFVDAPLSWGEWELCILNQKVSPSRHMEIQQMGNNEGQA